MIEIGIRFSKSGGSWYKLIHNDITYTFSTQKKMDEFHKRKIINKEYVKYEVPR